MYLKCFHILEILYHNDAELCWNIEKSGLNLTCTGSGSQLAAAHMEWAEYLRLLPSEWGLLWRTLPQITPKLTAWESSEWTWLLSHFHFLCCEQVTNPQKLILILSSKTCENTPHSLIPSFSSSPQHTNYYWCDGGPHCTVGPRDRALPFARQLNETLQEPRAGMHSPPTASSALGTICSGISTWSPKVPLSQGWKKSAAWHKKGKNLVGMCTDALLRVCGSQSEGRKEEIEAQELEQSTLCGLQKKGWWSSKEPACTDAQGRAVSCLMLGC